MQPKQRSENAHGCVERPRNYPSGLINQLVSTMLAAVFLPFVSKHGYSSMFFLFACFTVIYFLTAAFLLPETKGKTLEEIEAHFERQGAR